MVRPSFVAALVVLGAALSGAAPGFEPSPAVAQQSPALRPRIKGRAYRLKVDSSPQQATVYWDSGAAPNPKAFGIAGYTPITLKVPKGPVKVIVEMAGFKPQEQTLDVRRSQPLTFTLERAPAMAKLDLQAGADGGAAGAEVFIDGADKGTAPNVFDVAAGRHQVEVRKPGYKPFSEWVELAEGEHRTRELALTRAEVPTGTLLVTSDAGGDVYLDGARKDVAPAIIPGVAAGDHVIEVRKEGIPPWRQTVTVVAGQQVKVAATFGASASGNGSLRVISNEPDVEVYIDGEDKGKAPVTMNDTRPGEHIVGARKKGFKPQEQTVRVASNENAIVSFRMEVAPPDRPHAGLKVQSTIPNAEVFLDGSSLGRAPVDRNDLDPGKHYVSVHRDGYTDFKREIVLQENQAMTLVADLSATGSLRILSTPEGAEVRLDGELVGRTPVARDAAAGDHVVEFRLKGYFDHKETMKAEGGREKVYSVDLKLIPTGPSPEQVAKRRTQMSSYGSRVNPVGGVTVDFGLGYPYYLTARIMVGALPPRALNGYDLGGLDVGVQMQTLFDVTNLGARARYQILSAGPFAMGVEGDGGYGAGVNGRSSWFFDADYIISLAFADIATVSAYGKLSLWDDHFCPPESQLMNGASADAYCGYAENNGNAAEKMTLFGTGPADRSFTGHRFYIGFSASAALDRMTSLFFQFEFVPLTNQYGLTPRQEFEGTYNQALIGSSDENFYFTGGVSLKF
ncbi:MAG TPA: PEGA domain-containing protein [Polyangia bacterium]|nr:PEGA domain-containing protein [Polyangia bacterium]